MKTIIFGDVKFLWEGLEDSEPGVISIQAPLRLHWLETLFKDKVQEKTADNEDEVYLSNGGAPPLPPTSYAALYAAAYDFARKNMAMLIQESITLRMEAVQMVEPPVDDEEIIY